LPPWLSKKEIIRRKRTVNNEFNASANENSSSGGGGGSASNSGNAGRKNGSSGGDSGGGDDNRNGNDDILQPNLLADIIAATYRFNLLERQDVLSTVDCRKRLQLVLELLHKTQEAQKLSKEIASSMQKRSESEMKEILIRKQIQDLKKELRLLKTPTKRKGNNSNKNSNKDPGSGGSDPGSGNRFGRDPDSGRGPDSGDRFGRGKDRSGDMDSPEKDRNSILGRRGDSPIDRYKGPKDPLGAKAGEFGEGDIVIITSVN
jgi:hypothetical protein